jgi:hypothetical protein
MDSYYSSPSYYYEPSCPLHDSYSSYYYPSYTDQSFSVYNNSPTNIYAQPTPSVEVAHSTPILNTTFETSMHTLILISFNICCYSSTKKSSPSSTTYHIFKRSSWYPRSRLWKKSLSWYWTSWTTFSTTWCTWSSYSSKFPIHNYSFH